MVTNRIPKCFCDKGTMQLSKSTEKITFRGKKLTIPVEQYICDACGLKVGTPEQTGAIQRAIKTAYAEACE